MQVVLRRLLYGAAMGPKTTERPNCLKMEGLRTAFLFIFKHFEAGGGVASKTLPQGGFREAKEAALGTLP